ncbi:MAG: hypothetical protein NVSMB51_08790 [Solirubrobacteraceae bacterium]
MWRLTLRDGPRVSRSTHASAGEALDMLARRLDELRERPPSEEIQFFGRTFDAAHQVAVRAELAGPRRVRAGLDLRGDGSTEAYTGRLRRTLIERQGRESALASLRRVLSEH